MFLSYTTLKDNERHIYREDDIAFELKYVSEGNRYKYLLVAKEDVLLEEAILVTDYLIDDETKYFLNGYQSWTDTNLLTIKNKERDLNKVPKFIVNKFGLNAYGDSYFYKYDKNILHGYDILYSQGKQDHFILNNNYKKAYLIIELLKKEKIILLRSDVKNIKVKKDEEFVLFDYYHFNSTKEGLALFGRLFHVDSKKIFGYTSWYNYYQNINENIILRDLQSIDERFDLFQIDDGYETFVGDWLDVDKEKFPNGLEGIVKEAHQKGLMAGLWLAPLVAEEKSVLYQTRKDLFKKESNGEIIKCGGNWSGFYALDLDNAEARDYIKKCLEHYMEMGFDFFKLDFLYSTNLGLYDGRSRAMVTSDTYEFLREVLKDKLILGCGANMMQAYKQFDYMRVGPDMSLKFDDVWYMRHLHRERISTKLTVQNTMTRFIFDGHLFGNDPDVFLLRNENNFLSEDQKYALLMINALYGSVFMASDNFADYDEKKKANLDKALDIFKNARRVLAVKNDDNFMINYELNGEDNFFLYNTKKGVFVLDNETFSQKVNKA